MPNKTYKDTVRLCPTTDRGFRINCNPKCHEDQALTTWPIAYKEGERAALEPSDELLEIGRKAIEDVLIKWRNRRLCEFTRSNGLVIREKDGGDSSIIRFGPETALRIGLKAILKAKLKEGGI